MRCSIDMDKDLTCLVPNQTSEQMQNQIHSHQAMIRRLSTISVCPMLPSS